jgi:hypothetical protein
MTAYDVWCRVTVVGPAGTTIATWSLGGPGRPDIGVVDRLARLQLAALRGGGGVRLSSVSAELAALLDLAGLRRKPEGQPECGKVSLGVEEERERGDPPG